MKAPVKYSETYVSFCRLKINISSVNMNNYIILYYINFSWIIENKNNPEDDLCKTLVELSNELFLESMKLFGRSIKCDTIFSRVPLSQYHVNWTNSQLRLKIKI